MGTFQNWADAVTARTNTYEADVPSAADLASAVTPSLNNTYVPQGSGTSAASDVSFNSGRPWMDVTAAVADGRQIGDGVMSSVTTPTVLTSVSALFTAQSVGKPIDVAGAGTTGAVLSTTIASYQSATQVTLSSPCLTTVGAAWAGWGTDNAAAIQAAITAAASTFVVHLPVPPSGCAYYCRTGMVGTTFTQINGDTYSFAIGPSGGTRLIFAPSVAVGYTAGTNNVLRRLILDGGYYAAGNTGVSLTSDLQMSQVQIYRFGVGYAATGAYYIGFEHCEIAYCTIGMTLTGCLNVNLERPTLRSNGTGISVLGSSGIRSLSIHGGSIEGFVRSDTPTPVVGILLPSGGSPSAVNLFGTYFEMGGGRSVDARGAAAGTTIGCYGTTQFVGNMVAGIDVSSGAATVSGNSNSFTSPAGTPVCYALAGNTGDSGLPTGDIIVAVTAGTYTDTHGVLPRSSGTGATYHAGFFYGAMQGTSDSFVATANTMYLMPFLVDKAHTFTGITVNITSAGATGSVVRLGIYADDGTGIPGVLVLDTGTIDGTLTTYQAKTISQMLPPGQYWLAVAGQGSPATQPTLKAASGFGSRYFGMNNYANGTSAGYYQSSVTGALPNPAVQGGDITKIPSVCLKA